jgi:hypothetical protein
MTLKVMEANKTVFERLIKGTETDPKNQVFSSNEHLNGLSCYMLSLITGRFISVDFIWWDDRIRKQCKNTWNLFSGKRQHYLIDLGRGERIVHFLEKHLTRHWISTLIPIYSTQEPITP